MHSLQTLQVEIYIFFKAIYRMWVACGQYSELDPLDVKDELFDLVKPRDPHRITLQDLVVSAGVLAAVLGVIRWRKQNSACCCSRCVKYVSALPHGSKQNGRQSPCWETGRSAGATAWL